MITVLAENAYKAAREVYKTVPKKTRLPVLSHILISGGAGRLAFVANNLEESAVEYCTSLIDGKPINTCVPARPFTDWLRIGAKSKDVIEMDFDQASCTLIIKTRSHRWDCKKQAEIYTPPAITKFKCIDGSEFPPIREEQ